MEKFTIDQDYIKKMFLRSKEDENFKDYTLMYVSDAENLEDIKTAIKSAVTYKHIGVDNVKYVTARKDGQLIGFWFFKNKDVIAAEEGNEAGAGLDYFADYNYAIRGAAYFKEAKAKGKTDMQATTDYNCDHVYFVDYQGDLHSMLEIPVAYLDIKPEEKESFMQEFIKVRKKLNNSCSLERKIIKDENGKEFTLVLAKISPDLYSEIRRNASTSKLNYGQNIKDLRNNIVLDLQQLDSKCNSFIWANPDYSKGESLSRENMAYISSRNKISIALIGNSGFAKDSVMHYYNKLDSFFGNGYKIEDLAFLPTKRSIEQSIETLAPYLDGRINLEPRLTIEESEVVEERVKRALGEGESGKYRYYLSLEKQKEADQKQEAYYRVLQESGQDCNKILSDVFNQGAINNFDGMNYYLQNCKELRERMNYKDPKTGRISNLKTVYDLGYKWEDRDEIIRAYGETGAKMYDRAYLVKFVNTMLDDYKTSGALYDLTALTQMYDNPKIEDKLIKSRNLTQSQQKIMQDINGYAGFDAYLDLVKRFNCAVDIRIFKKYTYEEETGNLDAWGKPEKVKKERIEELKSYEPNLYHSVRDKLGNQIVTWKMSDSPELGEPAFVYSYRAFGENQQPALKALIDECTDRIDKRYSQMSLGSGE